MQYMNANFVYIEDFCGKPSVCRMEGLQSVGMADSAGSKRKSIRERIMDAGHFNESYGNLYYRKWRITQTSVEPIFPHLAPHWRTASLRNVAESWSFDPPMRSGDEIPEGYDDERKHLNMWTGLTHVPTPLEPNDPDQKYVDDYFTHIDEVIADNDVDIANEVKKWFAFLVKYPGELHQKALVVVGVEGCGKSMLSAPMLALFGPHAMRTANDTHYAGQFDIHTMDKVFLHGDEAIFHNDHKQEKSMKALITDLEKMFHGKNKTPTPGDNHMSVFLTSNDSKPAPIKDGSRRYFALKASPIALEDPKRGPRWLNERRVAWLRPKVAAAIAHRLLELSDELGEWTANSKIHETEFMRESRTLQLGIVQDFLKSRLQRGALFFGEKHVGTSSPTYRTAWVEDSDGRRARHPDLKTADIEEVKWTADKRVSMRHFKGNKSARLLSREQRFFDEFIEYSKNAKYGGEKPNSPEVLIKTAIAFLLPIDASDEVQREHKNQRNLPSLNDARKAFAKRIYRDENFNWDEPESSGSEDGQESEAVAEHLPTVEQVNADAKAKREFALGEHYDDSEDSEEHKAKIKGPF